MPEYKSVALFALDGHMNPDLIVERHITDDTIAVLRHGDTTITVSATALRAAIDTFWPRTRRTK